MHDTNHRIDKDRMGPGLDERPLSFSMSPNGAIFTEKLNPLFLASRGPTVDHSLAAGGAQRQWLQACLPDGHKPQ